MTEVSSATGRSKNFACFLSKLLSCQTDYSYHRTSIIALVLLYSNLPYAVDITAVAVLLNRRSRESELFDCALTHFHRLKVDVGAPAGIRTPNQQIMSLARQDQRSSAAFRSVLFTWGLSLLP